jgi:hypothetical protein
MKSFLEKTFNISIGLGAIAVLFCLLSISKFFFILAALAVGFFGFIACCIHIVYTQRFGLKQPPIFMLLLSLFLNSVPLIYMIVMVTQARGK